MVLFFWLLSSATESRDGRTLARRLVAAAVALVACVATRPVAVAFLPIALVHLVIGRFGAWQPALRDRLTAAARLALLVGAGMLLIVAYNGLLFSVWGLKSFNGRNFYNRVVGEARLVDGDGPATQRMRALIRRDVKGYWWDSLYALRSSGLDVQDADQLMGAVAWEGFRRHTTLYVTRTARDFVWVISNAGYPFNPENPHVDLEAYRHYAHLWARPNVPEERLLRETFLAKVRLVGPGEILPTQFPKSRPPPICLQARAPAGRRI